MYAFTVCGPSPGSRSMNLKFCMWVPVRMKLMAFSIPAAGPKNGVVRTSDAVSARDKLTFLKRAIPDACDVRVCECLCGEVGRSQ